MHQRSDATNNSLRVINQPHQLAHGSLAAQVNDALESGMVMACAANLDKLNFALEMVDDLLMAGRVPPLDRYIGFAARIDDPKGSIFAGQLMDLRIPEFLLIG